MITIFLILHILNIEEQLDYEIYITLGITFKCYQFPGNIHSTIVAS